MCEQKQQYCQTADGVLSVTFPFQRRGRGRSTYSQPPLVLRSLEAAADRYRKECIIVILSLKLTKKASIFQIVEAPRPSPQKRKTFFGKTIDKGCVA